MTYEVTILPTAIADVQHAVNYYDEQSIGLGEQFENELDDCFTMLETTPHFQIRYDEVHCLPMRRFPFMIHYTVNEQTLKIVVHAVFHTSLHPKKWKMKR